MKLSTKGAYAVRSMLYMATKYEDKNITLVEISKNQDVSLSYLEQLFAKLRRNGLVKSHRGPGGGYQLSKSPELTNVSSILHAVEEPLDVRKCKGRKNCQNKEQCLSHHLWSDLSDTIENFLSSISLSDIINGKSLVNLKK